MNLEAASAYAEVARIALAPWCHRCEIAGSIRRGKLEVKDAEIVCIPKRVTRETGDLFAKPSIVRHPNFVRVLDGWQATKGTALGKYTQCRLPSGLVLDLFMATADNWGLIFAIRTGSAEYSHKVLAAGWVRAGYKSIGGMLHQDGVAVPVREERDLFALIGVPYVRPCMRVVGP